MISLALEDGVARECENGEVEEGIEGRASNEASLRGFSFSPLEK